MSRWRIARLVAACAIVVWASATTALAQDFDPAQITTDRALMAETAAKQYAKDNGVTEERARTVLDMQARGTDLSEVLPKELGSSFGQVWFRDGHYNLYIQAGGDLGRARDLLAERGVSSTAIVREVPWNADDLRRELGALAQHLTAEGSPGDFAALTTDGGIEITLSASASESVVRAATDADQRAASSPSRIPVNVVHADYELGTPRKFYALPGYGGPPWIAGMINRVAGYAPCTTGFYARAIGNYFLTAGHCLWNGNAQQQIASAPNRWVTAGVDVGGYDDTYGDAGVIASWDVMAPYPALLNWLQPTYVGVAVFGASLSTGGFYYCHTGVGSAKAGHSATTCGTNHGYQAFVQTHGAPPYYRQTLRGNVCGYGSDSGGPVWDINIGHAIGIFNGGLGGADYAGQGCGTNMILNYSDAKPAAAVLGVTIATIN